MPEYYIECIEDTADIENYEDTADIENYEDMSNLPIFDAELMRLNGQWRREDMFFVITLDSYPETILALENVWLLE